MGKRKKELTKSEKMSIAQRKRWANKREQEAEGKRNAQELFGEDVHNAIMSPDLEIQLASKNGKIAELEYELEQIKGTIEKKNKEIYSLQSKLQHSRTLSQAINSIANSLINNM